MWAADIKTGMIGLVRKPNLETLDGLAEEVIAELTKGRDFYHVFWIYRDASEALRVSEMVRPTWRDITFEERLADLDGELCIGVMPSDILDQPDKVLAFLVWFAAQTALHPYGDSSLLKAGVSSDFDVDFDLLKEQPVCSLLVERGTLTVRNGVFVSVDGAALTVTSQGNSNKLWTPNDCAAQCVCIEPYEPEVN